MVLVTVPKLTSLDEQLGIAYTDSCTSSPPEALAGDLSP